jgi:hypothetical protein
MATGDRNPMPALKGLVYAMAVLIVLAIVLLAYGFYARLTSPDFKLFKGGESKATPPAEAAGFGEIDLALPPGCAIVGMEASERYLFLRIGPEGSCERVIVFDASDGSRKGALVGRR